MNHEEIKIRNQKIVAHYQKENLSIKALSDLYHLTVASIEAILGKGFWREKRKLQYQKRMNDAVAKAEALAHGLKRLPTMPELNGIVRSSDKTAVRARLIELGYKGQQHNYSKKYLLSHLTQLAKTLGRTPGQPDIIRDGTVTVNPYVRKFGSMRKAQQAAGLVPNRNGYSFGKNRRHDDEYMLEHLREVARELGRSPYGSDINAKGKIDKSAYQRHFGSMKNARDKAGLEQPEHIKRFLKRTYKNSRESKAKQ